MASVLNRNWRKKLCSTTCKLRNTLSIDTLHVVQQSHCFLSFSFSDGSQDLDCLGDYCQGAEEVGEPAGCPHAGQASQESGAASAPDPSMPEGINRPLSSMEDLEREPVDPDTKNRVVCIVSCLINQ